MNKEIEILAPGGDIASIKAAILAGADAVYCGLDRFNARNKASNISFEELKGVMRLAHKNNSQVFLTLNILITETEIQALFGLLNKLVNTSIDGIIVQDLGLYYILSKYFKNLLVHASTQMTTHNGAQLLFLSKLNVRRVNLSRELNIHEIKALTKIAHDNKLSTEVFVHGSSCISFSGICYMSSVHGGNSGNRGRCSQPCRDRYETTAVAIDYPLNLKDNSAFFDVNALVNAGVDSLKIEGRIKKADYVYTVVKAWKQQIRSFYDHKITLKDNSDLYKVFNRDFSNSFLKGKIHKDMFIDNPRDHSLKHFTETAEFELSEKELLAFYEEKEQLKIRLANEIEALSIAKIPLNIKVYGESGNPLKLHIQTPDTSFEFSSKQNLDSKGSEAINYAMLMKRLKVINDTEYYIETLDLENLQQEVYLSFKELSALKKTILFILNDSKETHPIVEVPVLKKQTAVKTVTGLAVFISDLKDVFLTKKNTASIYFLLPDSFKNEIATFADVFNRNKQLIPCFPSILIGEDFAAAILLLQQIKPKLIVTNNTGIAYEAFKKGISWIAGPYLNIVNSYSLICLKEKFNCCGAFLSNEINKEQLQRIHKPDDFKLYYSIHHPILLMTSRQCLMHQVTGCEKDYMDDLCLQECEQTASITNHKKQRLGIEKTKGNYHRVYHEMHFLNTAVVNDLPGFFDGFSIDISNVKTLTQTKPDKKYIITLFENLLKGKPDAIEEINQRIYPTTNLQYIKGI